jgi:hypothetical protein
LAVAVSRTRPGTADGDGEGRRDIGGKIARASSKVDAKFAEAAFGFVERIGSLAAVIGMLSSEKLWTTGYCVAIVVPSMDAANSQTVSTGSTTPFTANVHHKFDQADLTVPVTATLGGGEVSVSPSGSQVPSPATFQYKSPDKDHETATVNLETHSKRGIATLTVKFWTASEGWILSAPGGLVSGKKCDGIGGDWVIDLVSEPLATTGTWVVTIDGNTLSGTYVWDALQKLDGGTATWHGTGRASIVVQPGVSVAMYFTGGTTKITARTSAGTSTQTVPGAGGQNFLWLPADDACLPK